MMGVMTDKDVLSISERRKAIDGTRLYNEAIERIRQLEAEIERMKPVVEAALNWNRTDYRHLEECEAALQGISDACDTYEEEQP